jgi:DNA-binding transcriptional regulator YhcF (GntR family)
MSEMDQPPYLRIVAALKLRMANGELRPGDQLPSIRELSREWNVAPATAAKALTVLRHEGLVVVRARSGTVVATTAKPWQPQRRPNPHVSSDRELTRERVIRTAIEIADCEGLNAMSMRGIAARLGVAAMSPYRFVDSKESLILLMTDAAYGEIPPSKLAKNWRGQLTLSARTLWDLYTKHPWLAHINALTRPLLLPNLMAHAETVFAALAPCRLDPSTVMHLHVLLYSYVHGIAIHLERKTQEEAATGLSDDAWMDTQATSLANLVTSGRYPAFAALIGNLDPGYELRLDELFEFGLKTLLDGFVAMIGG